MTGPRTNQPTTIQVIEPGPLTTVQDWPGRIGYWNVGVPPSGPMDDLSHRLVNGIVGNRSAAATLELTGSGPTLQVTGPAVVSLGGAAMRFDVNGRTMPLWTPIHLESGAVVHIGAIEGAGQRSYLAVRGGFDVPAYLGSRSTFTLGGFGGWQGRALQPGDELTIGDAIAAAELPGYPSAGLVPVLHAHADLAVTIGPHAAPDFLTSRGLAALLNTTWEVHHNSARTGVRLVGPKPQWARDDGGDAGLHPSNIHDTGYAIGAVDLTGDMPVVLGPDGPSLGGFVCPAVVVAADRWKLGQLRPGDRVRLVPVTIDAAEARNRRSHWWITRATERIEPVARPEWQRAPTSSGTEHDAIIARRDADGEQPCITYRQAGDRFLLVEFGPMELDIELRLRVHALEQWVNDHFHDGIVDVTAGVRSLLIHVDGRTRHIRDVVAELRTAEAVTDNVRDMTFPSRVVHLPLSWDDPATRLAIERYMNGVRADAPWCPWNIEFIRRINGLASVDDVHRIVFDASYLVLGLGDVYLGAPVATPIDPRHRLVTTKYNPARTWTPENAVGIGGAYLCIYGMEGPGGYQFVGRTVQVWNTERRGTHFEQPWLLRQFDQLRFHPVDADELIEQRAAQAAGELELKIEHESFRLVDHQRFLDAQATEIDQFRHRQRAAFADERRAWAELAGKQNI